MGSRDHSVTCETCGLQRGGFNDYKCRCDTAMKHHVIEDYALAISVTLGAGADKASACIAWSGGSCLVAARALCRGFWVLTDGGDAPPADVVCRATALVIGVCFKERVQKALEELP